ncbi:acyl-CoA dehydrogenase [Pseudonocardia ailaonensis]|uniref:Acyl-CoA dehydrogenase n=1 Tax=Pseudonocardia ailaonensis TaxID=367279 RepID=A0ABN2N4X5_9PSEU
MTTSTSDAGFRTRVRTFLQDRAKPAGSPTGSSTEDLPRADASPLQEAKAFQRAVWDAGLAGITWPREYGGQGLSTDELVAYNQVAADFELPTIPLSIGMGMVGPTLVELGTDEQKARYLPPLLRGDEVWCQMFSEPDAGSDVAALRTRALRTADGWVVSGQKTWTSNAQWSDYGVVLARTDPSAPKHRGITMFVVDMHAPGVTVRPLVVATGLAPFNEVFFDGVALPADAVVGEVDRGWQAAVAMLRHERVSIGTRVQTRANALGFDSLTELVRSRRWPPDPVTRRQLADAHVREAAVLAYGQVLQAEVKAGIEAGARGSVAKLAGAELRLWQARLAQELLGPDIALGAPGTAAAALGIIAAPGVATAGGTNEIQRNIIAERILGLPKDGGIAARDTPFDQIRTTR